VTLFYVVGFPLLFRYSKHGALKFEQEELVIFILMNFAKMIFLRQTLLMIVLQQFFMRQKVFFKQSFLQMLNPSLS